MRFLSKFLAANNIKALEKKADDVLELPGNLKAIRFDGKVYVADYKKNKIINKAKDTFPSNPARATLGIMKKFKIDAGRDNILSKNASEEDKTWTCSFRPNEERWVWYKNNEPKMTVSYNEAYSGESNKEKENFQMASYGTLIIENIKKKGLKETNKEINGLILENSYTKIACQDCKCKDNYTIDDIVDENKKAKYDAQFVVCSNCNGLIKLV